MGFFSKKKKVQNKLQIKGFPGHIDSCKCLYLAAVKGLDVELDMLDMSVQAQDEDAYLALSPFGKVPSLTEDTLQVSGVAAILPYIDIKGGGPSLSPRKATNLGLQNYWIDVGNNEVMPRINIFIKEQLLGTMKDSTYLPNQEIIDVAIDELKRAFDIADNHLINKDHFANDFTFAEVHWVPYLHFCSITGHQDLINARPALKQWFEKMKNNATYNTLPGRSQFKDSNFKNVA